MPSNAELLDAMEEAYRILAEALGYLDPDYEENRSSEE